MDNEVQIEVAQMNDAQAQPHRFVWRFERNDAKSLEAGRPICDPVIFVQVVSSEGECRDIKYIKANDFHKRKFPIAWKNFRDNIAPEVDMGMQEPLTIAELREMYPELYEKYRARVAKQTGGTLLCEWNQCPAQTAIELKYCGIFTVEDLVDSEEEGLVPDSLLIAAKEYLAQCADAGHINILARGLIEAKATIDRQRQEIERLRQNRQ